MQQSILQEVLMFSRRLLTSCLAADEFDPDQHRHTQALIRTMPLLLIGSHETSARSNMSSRWLEQKATTMLECTALTVGVPVESICRAVVRRRSSLVPTMPSDKQLHI